MTDNIAFMIADNRARQIEALSVGLSALLPDLLRTPITYQLRPLADLKAAQARIQALADNLAGCIAAVEGSRDERVAA